MAENTRDIIIDAGGRDSVELRAAMTVADALYIPIQASQFDVWTLGPMNSLVEQAQAINERLRAFAVLNRASTNPSVKEAEDARRGTRGLRAPPPCVSRDPRPDLVPKGRARGLHGGRTRRARSKADR